MSYKEISNLTFPQAYQFMDRLQKIYKEQHKAMESNKINQVLGQMRHGRK